MSLDDDARDKTWQIKSLLRLWAISSIRALLCCLHRFRPYSCGLFCHYTPIRCDLSKIAKENPVCIPPNAKLQFRPVKSSNGFLSLDAERDRVVS
jgi:hypothetical protein